MRELRIEREKVAREEGSVHNAPEANADGSADYGRLKEFLATDDVPSGYKHLLQEMTNFVVQSKTDTLLSTNGNIGDQVNGYDDYPGIGGVGCSVTGSSNQIKNRANTKSSVDLKKSTHHEIKVE